MPRTNSLKVICTLAVLLLVQLGYASHHSPDYPVRPAGEYTNKVAKAGLIVAVEPVEDLEQQKIFFNSHLSSKGILPVFIVIQNTSATDEYLFDKSAVALVEYAPEVTVKDEHKPASLAGSVALHGPGAVRGAIFAHKVGLPLGSGGLVDASLMTDSTGVRQNLMKREVRGKMLSPGSSVSGFVYVPVSTDAHREKIHLQVPLTNVQNGEIEVVNLFI